MIGIFRLLERFLAIATQIKGPRETTSYQGGENISAGEARYASAIFPYTMYFLILHVLGFLAATIYVLVKLDESPFNWATIIFGLLMFYITLLVRKGIIKK